MLAYYFQYLQPGMAKGHDCCGLAYLEDYDPLERYYATFLRLYSESIKSEKNMEKNTFGK